MTGHRSPTYEKDWLEQVMREAGVSPQHARERLGEQIAERLQKGAEEYGEESYLEQGPALFSELKEEAADICTWGVLASQWLYAEEERGLSNEAAHEIRLELMGAAADAVRAWFRIQRAKGLFDDQRVSAPTMVPVSGYTHYFEE